LGKLGLLVGEIVVVLGIGFSFLDQWVAPNFEGEKLSAFEGLNKFGEMASFLTELKFSIFGVAISISSR